MKVGTDTFFDGKKVFGGKGIVLRKDNSVVVPMIRKSDGKPVEMVGGVEVPVLDAAQPYFGGTWPDLRHPEF